MNKPRIYRMRFLPGWLCISGFSVILGNLLFPLIVLLKRGSLDGIFDRPMSFVVGTCAALMFTSVFTLMMVAALQMTVDEDGIKGFNFWGMRTFLRWDELIELKPFNMLGLRFIRLVSSQSRWPIWLPVFLGAPAEFSADLRNTAGDGNPVVTELADAMSPARGSTR